MALPVSSKSQATIRSAIAIARGTDLLAPTSDIPLPVATTDVASSKTSTHETSPLQLMQGAEVLGGSDTSLEHAFELAFVANGTNLSPPTAGSRELRDKDGRGSAGAAVDRLLADDSEKIEELTRQLTASIQAMIMEKHKSSYLDAAYREEKALGSKRRRAEGNYMRADREVRSLTDDRNDYRFSLLSAQMRQAPQSEIDEILLKIRDTEPLIIAARKKAHMYEAEIERIDNTPRIIGDGYAALARVTALNSMADTQNFLTSLDHMPTNTPAADA